MKIALDAVGGDHGPAPCIEGAVQAVKELDVEIILVGDEATLKQECARLACHDSRVSIRHASQVVEMHESPAAVARKKRDSSIWVGTELVKNGQADAIVSPGELTMPPHIEVSQAWGFGISKVKGRIKVKAGGEVYKLKLKKGKAFLRLDSFENTGKKGILVAYLGNRKIRGTKEFVKIKVRRS